MAARSRMGRLSVILIFGLSFLLHTSSTSKPLPSNELVSRWMELAGNKVKKRVFILSTIQDVFQDVGAVEGVSMKYQSVSAKELVETMATTLSAMLMKKVEALRLSVDAAEKAAKEHKWDGDLEINDVHYYNCKNMVDDGVPMIYSERFGKAVNFNFSGVHIPVEIYEGNIDILNGLNWTSAIDKQFEENYKADNEILWQYFGSQTGFMRTYPATNWVVQGVDLYDVRRQSWYTQGSSSPKDMMILIDTSGSTYGQSLQLMKNAVKSILNTLGENDFVNVASFSTEAQFVSSCFNHTAFVQANYRNKLQLERDVDNLTAFGQADFTTAITFAFEEFDRFSRNETNDENNMGANCNKVIMLLTDGGTDNAEEVFQKYNWPNKTVRVFTYAVGPTPNPIHAIRWMACANRGYFSQIPAMGAIRARVQEYIPVLSRPQVIKNKKSYEWGNIYMDRLVSPLLSCLELISIMDIVIMIYMYF